MKEHRSAYASYGYTNEADVTYISLYNRKVIDVYETSCTFGGVLGIL